MFCSMQSSASKTLQQWTFHAMSAFRQGHRNTSMYCAVYSSVLTRQPVSSKSLTVSPGRTVLPPVCCVQPVLLISCGRRRFEPLTAAAFLNLHPRAHLSFARHGFKARQKATSHQGQTEEKHTCKAKSIAHGTGQSAEQQPVVAKVTCCTPH